MSNTNMVALKGFFKLSKLWGVKREEQCKLLGGNVERTTLTRWENAINNGTFNQTISIDQLDRISYLLGIHRGLRLIHTEKQHAYEWVDLPNKIFGGLTPLEYMLNNPKMMTLQTVRYYVDDMCGGYAE